MITVSSRYLLYTNYPNALLFSPMLYHTTITLNMAFLIMIAGILRLNINFEAEIR